MLNLSLSLFNPACSYKKNDQTSFKYDIDSIPWQYIVSLDDPINAWQIWKNLFLEVVDKHAPVKQRRIRKTCAPYGSLLKSRN